MMSTYQERIREALHSTRDLGLLTVEPRAVEALLRSDYGTLDHLPAARFAAESRACARELATLPREEQLRIAESFGL